MSTHIRTALAVFISAIVLVACGGGGGGSANNTPATVGVLVTDAPDGQWDQAIATITSVTLIGDSGQVTLFSGSQTLDLLRLGDFSELFAVSDTVPPGQYSKIRLQLSDLILNDIDPDTGLVAESVHPQLVGNGKLDLNPQGSFTIAPGDFVFVVLDFDMRKSLKITETGSGKLIVRPVVFVDIQSGQPGARLSRIHGSITEVDATAGALLLCQSSFASQDEQGDQPDFGTDHCVTVRTDASTGIFGADGQPQDFAGLAVGDEATAIGHLRRLDDDTVMSEDHPFAMDAVVIEEGPLGTFRRIAGAAASGVDAGTSRFDLNVAPGQGIATDVPLPVQLYDHSRIFNRFGEELGRDDIVAGGGVLADGVLQTDPENLLHSPFLILGSALPPGETVLRGDIVSVDTATHSLVMTTETGDRCVDATNADVFLVGHDDGLSFTRGALADLVPGQQVAVFGTDGACLVADTILAEQ